jgi:hypothetical protein
MSSGADTPTQQPVNAAEILQSGIAAMAQRAKTRDHADGERSIERAVAMFNVLRGYHGPRDITAREGWILMALLKLSRAQGGAHLLDDYIDGAAYIALAGETAEREQDMPF